jgi:hypothetical protein
MMIDLSLPDLLTEDERRIMDAGSAVKAAEGALRDAHERYLRAVGIWREALRASPQPSPLFSMPAQPSTTAGQPEVPGDETNKKLVVLITERAPRSVDELTLAVLGKSDLEARRFVSGRLQFLKEKGLLRKVRKGWWETASPGVASEDTGNDADDISTEDE